MNEYVTLLKKEVRSIAKEKTIVFAIIVQLFIASFSSVILTGIMAFYDPASLAERARFVARVGYVGDIDSPLVGYLRNQKIIVRPFAEAIAAERAFRERQVDAIILAPTSHSGTVDIKLILPKLETTKIFILVMVDEPLKKYESYLREANGIPVSHKGSDGKPYSTYELLYAVIVPILILFPALIAGSIVIDTVSEEFENKTFETLMSAPVSAKQVFSAKISAAVITAVVQIGMWIGLLTVNGITIQNPTLLLVAAVIFTNTISFGAAIIAQFFKDRERSQFAYSMTFVISAAGTYFLNPSPFNLLTQLAAGVPGVGGLGLALYAIPLMVLLAVFFSVSDRLTLART